MWEALKYPVRGVHAEKALLSAWLCVFVHAVAVPVLALVPLVGYATTVLSQAHEETPPPFLERSVLVRGLGGTALAVGYGLLPLVATLVALQLLFDGGEPTEGEAIVFLAASTAVLFVLAGYVYVLPIALANYGQTGSLRSSASGLLDVATHAGYFVGWTSGIVLTLVGLTLSSALIELGGLSTVVGAFVGGYAVIVGCRRIGRGYAAAR